jgi:branched-subunit amino acid transport protein
MSWTAILLLAAGAYACKAIGLVVLGGRDLPAPLSRCVALLPAALLPALIAVGTFATGDRWAVDARAAGVAAAVVAAWRRAPFPVIVVLGAAVTTLVRAAA